MCFLWWFLYIFSLNFHKIKTSSNRFYCTLKAKLSYIFAKNYIKDFTRSQFQMFSFFGSKHQTFFNFPRNLCVTSNEKFKSKQYLQNGFRFHHSEPGKYSKMHIQIQIAFALLCSAWLAITSHSCKLLQNERELVGMGCGKAWQNRSHFEQSGETYI